MAPFGEIVKFGIDQMFGKTSLPNIDLMGKTIVVTGANTGLGLACVKHLTHLNASHVIIGCRNKEKGNTAKDAVLRETGRKRRINIEVWEVDLASYQSVLRFGERIRTQLPRLDAFIANAGMETHEFKNAEDLEMHLTVNVVSTFLSSIAVLPKLRQTSKEHGVQTTLTLCGSSYHLFGPDAEFDAGLADDVDMFDILSDQSKTDMLWRYPLSKLMVHQCFRELAACVSHGANNKTSDVVVNIVNPGWCRTELSRNRPHPAAEKMAFALMGWTSEKGSRVYVHAMAAGKESHGWYLSECQIKSESQYVRSERGLRIQKKMWSDLVKRIGGISPEVAGYIC